MSAISDALAIDHFTCAKGSSVERPFLEAVAYGLGFDGSRRQFPSKDLLLAAIIEATTGRWPDETDLDGGTVTNQALRAILDGIVANDLARVSLTDGPAAVRVTTALFEEDGDPTVFDPLDLSDERKRSLRKVVIRGEQAAFRNRVLAAYEGRCAVTGCDVPEALEAAHIRPYSGPKSSAVANGLLLRADVHRLWDKGLMAVHDSIRVVLLSPSLQGTEYEREIGDRKIRLPSDPVLWPAKAALAQQREWAGL
ncbi:HNH endonuclease [Promicromonospora sp. NPDC023987]|uniref:HNH endonuclease n=1 Tax=Promicromonospora sp. NPDC023987 TaxID=3155360 RepID=UPI0033E4E19E